jgi:hypothetical protein
MDLSENRGPKNLMLSHQLFPIKLVQCSSWLCGSSPFSDILLWEIHEIVNLLGLSDNASQSKRPLYICSSVTLTSVVLDCPFSALLLRN